MKKLLLLILVVIGVSSLSAQGFGSRELLNKNWKFTLSNPKYAGAEFHDDSKWRNIEIPHDWSVEGLASPTNASCTGYLPGGIGWYRKSLDISAEKKGEKVYVYFEGVYNNSDVYINGKWIGKRPNGYISFCYDITPYINFGGRNVLAVSVDHTDYADSRWYTGSGIYRDAWLVYANPVHINLWGVHYSAVVNGNNAQLDVNTEILNETKQSEVVDIEYTLLDRKGKQVATTKSNITIDKESLNTSTSAIQVKNPVLWGLDNPYLYTLQTKVFIDGKQIDQTETKVGIRKLSFDADKGFALNDKRMKLKGVCLHHDAGGLGAAVPKEVWKRRILKLKELGCNAIRMSHNPQASSLYEVCDEVGILVMDEAFDEWEYPKKKWLEGWNVGTPGFQGSSHYFREWCKRDLSDMIRRDRNHPSIIMWSIGNEVDYPNDPYSHPVLDKEGISQIHEAGYKKSQPHANRLGEIARELAAEAKKYDTSRPVTAALAGAVMSNETAYPYELDVVGYNYTEDRYDQDHKKYPKRILYGSENRHDLQAWKSVRDKDFIFGQFLWTGFDYLGESGKWPSRGFSSGLIDFTGEPKARGYFRRALWAEEPVVYVGTCSPSTKKDNLSGSAKRVWNYSNEEKVRVVAYTNCDEAELFLNGKPYGARKRYDDNTAIIYWDVPYKAGILSVTGYNNGKKTVQDKIQSSGLPYVILANLYDKKIATNEMVQIEIQILDKDGIPVTLADNEIQCRVKGNAKLVSLDSGSNNVADNYRDNRQRCHNGKLIAYIRAGSAPGAIEVTLSSPLLKSSVLNFNVEK